VHISTKYSPKIPYETGYCRVFYNKNPYTTHIYIHVILLCVFLLDFGTISEDTVRDSGDERSCLSLQNLLAWSTRGTEKLRVRKSFIYTIVIYIHTYIHNIKPVSLWGRQRSLLTTCYDLYKHLSLFPLSSNSSYTLTGFGYFWPGPSLKRPQFGWEVLYTVACIGYQTW
jgi:hypothetical protein